MNIVAVKAAPAQSQRESPWLGLGLSAGALIFLVGMLARAYKR